MVIREDVEVDAVDALMLVVVEKDPEARVLVSEVMWMSVWDETAVMVARDVVMPGRWRGCWVMRFGREEELLNRPGPGPAEFLGEGEGFGREKSAATASDMMVM